MVVGLIPGQGTYRGCGFSPRTCRSTGDPQSGHMLQGVQAPRSGCRQRQLCDVSLSSLFLSLPPTLPSHLSLKKQVKISLGENKKTKIKTTVSNALYYDIMTASHHRAIEILQLCYNLTEPPRYMRSVGH